MKDMKENGKGMLKTVLAPTIMQMMINTLASGRMAKKVEEEIYILPLEHITRDIGEKIWCMVKVKCSTRMEMDMMESGSMELKMVMAFISIKMVQGMRVCGVTTKKMAREHLYTIH